MLWLWPQNHCVSSQNVKRLLSTAKTSYSYLFSKTLLSSILIAPKVHHHHQWLINLSATQWLWRSAFLNTWELWLSNEGWPWEINIRLINLGHLSNESKNSTDVRFGVFHFVLLHEGIRRPYESVHRRYEWGLRVFQGPSNIIRALRLSWGWSWGPKRTWQEECKMYTQGSRDLRSHLRILPITMFVFRKGLQL